MRDGRRVGASRCGRASCPGSGAARRGVDRPDGDRPDAGHRDAPRWPRHRRARGAGRDAACPGSSRTGCCPGAGRRDAACPGSGRTGCCPDAGFHHRDAVRRSAHRRVVNRHRGSRESHASRATERQRAWVQPGAGQASGHRQGARPPAQPGLQRRRAPRARPEPRVPVRVQVRGSRPASRPRAGEPGRPREPVPPRRPRGPRRRQAPCGRQASVRNARSSPRRSHGWRPSPQTSGGTSHASCVRPGPRASTTPSSRTLRPPSTLRGGPCSSSRALLRARRHESLPHLSCLGPPARQAGPSLVPSTHRWGLIGCPSASNPLPCRCTRGAARPKPGRDVVACRRDGPRPELFNGPAAPDMPGSSPGRAVPPRATHVAGPAGARRAPDRRTPDGSKRRARADTLARRRRAEARRPTARAPAAGELTAGRVSGTRRTSVPDRWSPAGGYGDGSDPGHAARSRTV